VTADRFDYTGKLAEKRRAEEAIAAGTREGKVASVNGDFVVEEPGIWDPYTGQRLSPAEEARIEAEEAQAKKRPVLPSRRR
jgi:hypothetical protein